MDQKLKSIQDQYIRELKKELPKLNKWLKAGQKLNEEKSYPGKMVLDFDLRWPTGASGHPRLIAIFRKYYLAAEAAISELQGDKKEYVPPIDLLINDLKGEHDDLHRVMRRMRLIPMGMKNGDLV